MPRMNISSRDTGTLGKAMDVLQIIALASEPLRFTDLLARMDQPRGTLHRHITNLIDEGLLAVRSDQTYELGLRLLNFAARSWSRNQLREIASPVLQRLHEDTGETVHLGLLSGTEIIYLDKMESRSAVRMFSQIGNAAPAYCTGLGKAALSSLSDEQVGLLFRDIAFKGYTPSTLTRIDALISALQPIRRDGYGFDLEEHEVGIHCIAAPVPVADGRIAVAISVTAPVFRVSLDQLKAFIAPVRTAATELRHEINARMSPRG